MRSVRSVGTRARSLARGLRRDRAGSILVEFAVSLPLLLSLYLGGYVISDAIACNRKLNIATRSAADLTSRNASLTTAQLSTILSATAQVMGPYYNTSTVITVSEVQVATATTATVIWSQSMNGTARTANTTITLPSGMTTSTMIPAAANGSTPAVTGAYFLLAESSYIYHPAIGWNSMTSFPLADSIYMVPRYSNSVPLS